jgi:hypothetical protein
MFQAFRYFLKIATGARNSKIGQQKPKPLPVFERPLHILIVEDNEINSRVLSRQLVKASLTFESAYRCSSPSCFPAIVGLTEDRAPSQVAINGQEGLDKIIKSMQGGNQAFDAVRRRLLLARGSEG